MTAFWLLRKSALWNRVCVTKNWESLSLFTKLQFIVLCVSLQDLCQFHRQRNVAITFMALWLEKIFFFKGQRCPGVSFQRIGCYKEKTQKGRPLSDLLFTDRKSSSSKWSGLKYAFQEFNAYLPDLACRCAKATKFKGYTVFGLTNYGKNDSLNLILTLNTRPLCLFSKHQPVIGSR